MADMGKIAAALPEGVQLSYQDAAKLLRRKCRISDNDNASLTGVLDSLFHFGLVTRVGRGIHADVVRTAAVTRSERDKIRPPTYSHTYDIDGNPIAVPIQEADAFNAATVEARRRRRIQRLQRDLDNELAASAQDLTPRNT